SGAIAQYIASFTAAEHIRQSPHLRNGSGEYRFVSVKAGKQPYRTDERKEILYRIERQGDRVGQMYLAAHIVDEIGAVVAQCDSRLVGHWPQDAEVIEGKFSF